MVEGCFAVTVLVLMIGLNVTASFSLARDTHRPCDLPRIVFHKRDGQLLSGFSRSSVTCLTAVISAEMVAVDVGLVCSGRSCGSPEPSIVLLDLSAQVSQNVYKCNFSVHFVSILYSKLIIKLLYLDFPNTYAPDNLF